MGRPRIRSIKPEFAQDEKNLALSDSCALFFILFWTICDDEGKCPNQPLAISKKLARWHQDKVTKFLRSLSGQAQVRFSSCSAWVQVTNWSHQRICRPQPAKIKAIEIIWENEITSMSVHTPFTEHSVSGSDRIGSDLYKGKVSEVINETESLFDQRWPAYEESFKRVFSPVHLKNIRFYRSKILKYFPTHEELQEYCNPFIENLLGAQADLSPERLSTAIFNKITKSVTEWERAG